MRDLGDRLDVDRFQRRIGRSFQKKRLGAGAHRLAPGVEIGAVDERRMHAVAGQMLLDDIEAGAEQRLGGDDMIAGANLPHQRRGDRRHSGRGRARRGRAFERRHALLEHGDGRIGEARILIAGLLVLEALFRAERGLVNVALREIQRLAGLRELRAQDTGMDELGFGAVASLGGHGHRGLLSPTKKPGRKSSAGSHVPGLLATCFTWLQAGRLK